MRVRTRENHVLPLTRLGATDYICLSPWSNSRSFLNGLIYTYAGSGMRSSELCIDENHGVRERYDVGGPLVVSIVETPLGTSGRGTYISGPGLLQPGAATHNGFDGSDWRIRYSGGFQVSADYWGDWPHEKPTGANEYHPFVNPGDLSSLGSRAYARLRPKVAHASAFQTLAEAKDIPRTLKKSLEPFHESWKVIVDSASISHTAKRRAREGWKRSPKELSQQYLNTVFGWAPLVDDVSKLCDVVISFDNLVERATRLNGEWQNRRWQEEEVVQEDLLWTQTGSQNFCTPWMSHGWVVPGTGKLQYIRRRVSQVWYEGSFKQYYPEFDASLMKGHEKVAQVAKAIRLSGLEVNPTNVYKVLPYTWLLDWGVNVGDNLQRISDMATDAVVSRYFYLMRRTSEKYIFRASWTLVSGGTVNVEAQAGRTMKRRELGNNAFGFSAFPGGLSGKQLTILAALGLSK